MDMMRWIKIAAAAISIAAIAVLAYALLTPEPQSDSTDHMGMMNGRVAYSSTNVGLIAASLAVLVVSLMVIVLWQEYEPLPPTMTGAPSRQVAPDLAGAPIRWPGERRSAPPEPLTATIDVEAERAAHNYLVLRLLTGDERTMFKALMDSNGEALQKDIIQSTKMSNAKVTRVLDRLLKKGVITKERYGSTNRIRIKLEP